MLHQELLSHVVGGEVAKQVIVYGYTVISLERVGGLLIGTHAQTSLTDLRRRLDGIESTWRSESDGEVVRNAS